MNTNHVPQAPGAELAMPTADELFGCWRSEPSPEPEPEFSVAWELANQERARLLVGALAEPGNDDAGDFGPGFYSSLRELHAKETVPADDLMIGVRRRQVAIFASVTSVGKTTLMLNHSLAAAGGQMWKPLLPDAPERPLKIIFIDAESTDDELKVDTMRMLDTIGNREVALD